MTSELFVLDIGHGSTNIICSGSRTVVVDGAPGPELLAFLRQRNITEIDAVLVSHADHDHVAGIVNLLMQPTIRVRRLYANPDASKETKVWKDLREAARDASSRGTRVRPSLTSDDSPDLTDPELEIEVLAPASVLALTGVGGTEPDGRPLDSNRMSAVVRIRCPNGGSALLPGDIDDAGIDFLIAAGRNLGADVLVFPHHGGSAGERVDLEAYAARVMREVSPSVVILSLDRIRYGLPREEVVRAVRAVADVHMACTQLSAKCAPALPVAPAMALEAIQARGALGGACCAGSIRIDLDLPKAVYTNAAAHSAFVRNSVPAALCLGE